MLVARAPEFRKIDPQNAPNDVQKASLQLPRSPDFHSPFQIKRLSLNSFYSQNQAGYLRELLVSCPRASTRLAFEHLAVDAVAASNPPKRGDRGPATANSEGEQQQQEEDEEEEEEEKEEEETDLQSTALARVLLDLLQDESYGAARGASPGGLSHVAAVAAAAASNTSQRDVLIAGRAVPLLLGCLKARHSHEIASAATPATAVAAAASSATGASGSSRWVASRPS